MNADGFAFDELRLEGLDREAVERGRAVKQHGMAAGDFFEDIPDFSGLTLDHFLGGADGVNVAELFEAADDERLKEHQSHLLGQTALVKLKFWADDNHRTAGVIDAFSEQVLAEASTLALEHIAERFEGTIAGASNGAAMASIVKQGVDCLLQHAFFVADDDFRGLELEQVFQPVIAVDDTAVEVVQIGSGEAPAL